MRLRRRLTRETGSVIDIIHDVLAAVPADQQAAVQSFMDMMEKPSPSLGERITVVDHLEQEVPALLDGTRLVVDSVAVELSGAAATWDGERLTLDDGEFSLELVADTSLVDVAVGQYGLAIRQGDGD